MTQPPLRGWLDELRNGLPQRSWLTYWAGTVESLEPALNSVRDRYDRVLDPQLLAAIDDFTLSGARFARELRWVVSLDNAVAKETDPPTQTWAPQILDQLEGSFDKIIALGRAYSRVTGQAFEIPDEIWESARVHRHSRAAGLPHDVPGIEEGG